MPTTLRGDTKRELRYAAIELEVAAIVAQATSLKDAGPDLLRTICQGFDFVLGEAWIVDEDARVLRWVAGWHALGKPVEFLEAARSVALVKGHGLAGRVWATGQPEWYPDVLADDAFLRAPYARKAGLRAGFGLALLWGERVSGVMLFFDQKTREAEPGIVGLAPALGRAIGRLALASTLEGRSDGFFRTLVENLGDVVFVVDMRGAVLYASPRTRGMGFLPEERAGKTPVDFIHKDDLPQVFSTLRNIVQSPRSEGRVQYRVRHKDGSWRLFESVGRLLSEGRAEPIIIVSARDVTERLASTVDETPLLEDREQGRDALSGSDANLSDHQLRILSLVGQGLTNRQIGEALSLSPNTVKDHLRSCMKRLGAKNRTEAALAVTKMGLI